MGMDSGQDTENAISDALEAATDDLAAQISNSFEPGSRQDDFVVSFKEIPETSPIIKLGLRRGFLSASPTVVAARGPDEFGTSTEVSVTSFDVDVENGVVSFWKSVDLGDGAYVSSRNQPNRSTWWFRVSYDHGFASGDGLTYDDVPGWLTRAAQLQARISLNAHPSFVQAQAVTDVKSLLSQLSRIVASKTRYLPWAMLPANSRAV